MGQVKTHPLEDLRDLESHPVPAYTDDRRYEDVPKAVEEYKAQGKYITCGIFMVLFERMHSLHGFENVLTGLYTNKDGIVALADRIVDVHVTFVKEVARRFPAAIDGWIMTDDWGDPTGRFHPHRYVDGLLLSEV